MSSIDTLTFYQGRQTNSRRVAPVPQLKCVGGDGRYEANGSVNVVQCRKVGSGYGNNIQWKCEAELPQSLRLGETTVSCEGFEHADDPFVLEGSCGLEYTLHKTRVAPHMGYDDHYDTGHSYGGSGHSNGGSGYSGYGGRSSSSSSIGSWIWSAWSSWWSFCSWVALCSLGWCCFGSSAIVWCAAAYVASSVFGISLSSMAIIGVLVRLLAPTRSSGGHHHSDPYQASPAGWGGQRNSYGNSGSSWGNFFTGMAAGGLASSMFGNRNHDRRHHSTTASSSTTARNSHYEHSHPSFSSSGTSSRRRTHTSAGFGGTRNR
jgi:hypothetical protein